MEQLLEYFISSSKNHKDHLLTFHIFHVKQHRLSSKYYEWTSNYLLLYPVGPLGDKDAELREQLCVYTVNSNTFHISLW